MLNMTLFALIATFSFTILMEIIEKLSMRGKTLGTFHSFKNPKGKKISPQVCYEYTVSEKTYYFTMDNYMKETTGENIKIKLMYNLKKPEKVAVDSGYVSLIIQVLFLGVAIIAKCCLQG